VTDLQVRRDDLHQIRFDDSPSAPLAEGEARLAVALFALTANNITYAVFGDAMQYWHFFPAPDPWGRIPVWGFAEVVESTVDGVVDGQRYYGYYPMASELVVRPGRVGERGFVDTADHRQEMAAAYNQYARTDADPVYDADTEPVQSLLRPLLYTSFLLDDFLADNGFFGARTVVLSSASSKTSAGTAFFLHQRGGEVEVVGLTSPANVEFTSGLGVYDRVLTYDDVASCGRGPAAYVDVAGDPSVRHAVHHHFGEDLVHSAVVGGTHWTAGPGEGGVLPGAAPAFFFAPEQIRRRSDQWGAAKLEEAFAGAWRRAVGWTDGWLEVRRSTGPDEVRAAYLEVLEGRSPPSVGHVLSLR
jgi:hypothetical protein